MHRTSINEMTKTALKRSLNQDVNRVKVNENRDPERVWTNVCYIIEINLIIPTEVLEVAHYRVAT